MAGKVIISKFKYSSIQMAGKVIISKFKFLIFKLWKFACLFTAMVRVNLVFSPKKQNSNGTLQLDTRGFNAAFSHWIPKCLNWTDLERPTESVSVEELKTSLTFYLWTICLREFRYLMNESSID